MVPFLKVRFSDHSARDILYVCADKPELISNVNKKTVARDLIFIFFGFKDLSKNNEFGEINGS
jgi:hypothetical protein